MVGSGASTKIASQESKPTEKTTGPATTQTATDTTKGLLGVGPVFDSLQKNLSGEVGTGPTFSNYREPLDSTKRGPGMTLVPGGVRRNYVGRPAKGDLRGEKMTEEQKKDNQDEKQGNQGQKQGNQGQKQGNQGQKQGEQGQKQDERGQKPGGQAQKRTDQDQKQDDADKKDEQKELTSSLTKEEEEKKTAADDKPPTKEQASVSTPVTSGSGASTVSVPTTGPSHPIQSIRAGSRPMQRPGLYQPRSSPYMTSSRPGLLRTPLPQQSRSPYRPALSGMSQVSPLSRLPYGSAPRYDKTT